MNEAVTLYQVRHNVQLSHYNAVATREWVRVAQEALENQQRHLEQIQAFVNEDLRPDIELVQSRTNVANAKSELIQAENAYALSKLYLVQAMGVENCKFEIVYVEPKPIECEDEPLDVLIEEALQQRPELSVMAKRLRVQDWNVKAAEAEYWPTLSASSGITWTGSERDVLALNWYVGLSLNWTFYEGGRIDAGVREAKANHIVLDNEAILLRQKVRVEVEQAYLQVHSSRARLSVFRESKVQALEFLRLAEGRYFNEVGNVIELSDAQLTLTTAQVNVLTAEYDLISARAALLKALGRE